MKPIYSKYRLKFKHAQKGGGKQLKKRKVWWELNHKKVPSPWKP